MKRGSTPELRPPALEPSRLACHTSLAQLFCAGTHAVAWQDEVTNPQAKSRLILLVVDLGCLCGSEGLSELTRVSPQSLMGVITSRHEGISSLLYGTGYSSVIIMKSMG